MPAISEMNTMARPRSSTGKEKRASMACIPIFGPELEVGLIEIEPSLCFSFISCFGDFGFALTTMTAQDQAGLIASII